MVTAIDSSVILDILTNDPQHRTTSLAALREAGSLGALIVCPGVWAELRGTFTDGEQMDRAFAAAKLEFDPFDRECAQIAGTMWRAYRRAGGSRARLIPDFLVGAHAKVRGGRLLTRDRGFVRR